MGVGFYFDIACSTNNPNKYFIFTVIASDTKSLHGDGLYIYSKKRVESDLELGYLYVSLDVLLTPQAIQKDEI